MIHQDESPEGRKLVRPATYWSHAGLKIATILSLTLRHQPTHDDPDVMKQQNGRAVFRFSGSSSPNEFYAALSVWEAPLFVATYPTDNCV